MTNQTTAEIMKEMRQFLRRVEDFGKLSGGQLRAKYDCDPMEGYEWIAKQGRTLRAKIDSPVVAEVIQRACACMPEDIAHG